MGTITRSHTFVAGEKPTDDQWNVDIDQTFTLINGNLDESNVDYSSSDGIVTLQQTQTITGTKTFDAATTFNTSILPDSTGGADMGSATQEWGDVYVADDKFIKFGSDQNVFVGYDETTTDSLKFAATEGAGLAITLMADEGDDAGDEWKLNVADGGTLTLGNDIASAGTYVTGLTITPNSTTAAWLMDFEGDIDVGGDTLSFNGAATIDTSGNNALSLDAGSATLTLDGGTIESDATTLSFDAATTIDTSGNNALSLDAGSAVLTLDGGTIESDASTFSFDGAATIDTSGNNALSLDAGSAVLTLDGGTIESDASTLSFDAAATIDTSGNNNLTLNAGTGSIVATAGDVTVFDDNNNADVSMSIGTSATEALVVQALNGSSNKTLEELRFTTKTASGTANHGKITFYIDEAEIGTIDDGGIDLASGMTFAINGSDLPSSAGDFSGPGSSTDNAVVRFDGTGGKTAQNSGVAIDDSNNVSGVGTLATTGDVTIFDDANNADTSLSIGTSATEALVVEALNGGSNKTLEELRFTTKTASATGDHGKMSFYVDEAEIATIDDGGIDLASGKSFTVNGSALSSGISWDGSTADGVATYKDGDEATVEANLTFDGTTLDVVGNAGVGIARTDGTLHVHTATAGSVTAATDANDLVVESNGTGGISILTPDANNGKITFGAPSDDDYAEIVSGYNGGASFVGHELANGEKMRIIEGTGVYIAATQNQNSNMTMGLTIDQAGNDNEIIALKSSDVAHGHGDTETNTYFLIKKAAGTTGGAYINAFKEDTTDQSVLVFHAHGGGAATSKSTTARALIELIADEHDGSGTTSDIPTNGLVCSVRGRVGGAERTLFVVDAEGDLHVDGSTSITAFDTYDDAQLIRALDHTLSDPAQVVRSKWDQDVKYNRKDLEDAGILGRCESDDPKEEPLVSVTQLQRLHHGAIWQQHVAMKEMEEEMRSIITAQANELAELKGQMVLLQEKN